MNIAEQEIIELMKREEVSNNDSLKSVLELQHEKQSILPPENEDAHSPKTAKVQATGNTYQHDPKNPAMLPIPQPLLISQFRTIKKDIKTGKLELRTYMAERELKFLFFLLHAVWEELEPGVEHTIDVLKAYKVLKNEYGINENTTTWLWDSASHLVETTVRWTEIQGDELFKGVGALLPYAITNEDARKTGILKFKFNEKLIPILKEPSRFTRLRLHFLMSLSGRYSILLYGILEGYANYDYKNVFTFELATIRSWLKIEPKKYKLYADMRRYVLEPAFKQIKKNPEGAGFSVSYKPIKRGRKVHAIEVTINKTATRIQLEDKLKAKKKRQAVEPLVLPTVRLDAEKLKRKAKAKGLIPRYDLYALQAAHEQAWRQWLWKTGKCDGMKDPEGSFVGFLLHKKAKGTL